MAGVSEVLGLEDFAYNWDNTHVGDLTAMPSAGGQKISISDIIESGTTLICAARPSYKSNDGIGKTTDGKEDKLELIPIGAVDSMTVQMGKSIQKIFEIGSKLAFNIPGRTQGMMSLQRAFFDGGGILKALYSAAVDKESVGVDGRSTTFHGNANTIESANIGSGSVTMNLFSSFFDNPFGMALIFFDKGKNAVGQMFFEDCLISSYQMNMSSQAVVLYEGVSIDFTNAVPIIVSAPTAKIKSFGNHLADDFVTATGTAIVKVQ